MREVRKEKITEIIRELAAEYIRDEAAKTSLITVTRTEMSASGKDAIIFFTTIPTEQEDTALKFLERKTSDFKNYLKDNSRLGILPHLRFKIDYGERNRQRLDELGAENNQV
jgi:ribosome-binding factor A